MGRGTNSPHLLPPDANKIWGEALKKYRWAHIDIDGAQLRTLFHTTVPRLTAEAAADLQKPISVEELLKVKSRWTHNKTFTDYTVQVINVLPLDALTLIANELTVWITNTPYLERTVIGIPKPGATDAPTDLDALIQWLLKYLRPITISPIFLALFNGIMAYRLASSEEFQLLLSEANVGFQRERSTHQIILYINSMIYLANTRRLPLWTFSTDIDKAYDKTPLVTQYQVGRHRGLEAFTRSTITTYKMSRISIQAIGTKPHTVQPDSGQNQDDANVCSSLCSIEGELQPVLNRG